MELDDYKWRSHRTPTPSHVLHRAASDAVPAYTALCEQVRSAPVVAGSHTTRTSGVESVIYSPSASFWLLLASFGLLSSSTSIKPSAISLGILLSFGILCNQSVPMVFHAS